MSDNVVKLPERRPPEAEWTIKMRMIFGPDLLFEFDLPDMAMTRDYAERMVAAFREAAMRKAP